MEAAVVFGWVIPCMKRDGTILTFFFLRLPDPLAAVEFEFELVAPWAEVVDGLLVVAVVVVARAVSAPEDGMFARKESIGGDWLGG